MKEISSISTSDLCAEVCSRLLDRLREKGEYQYYEDFVGSEGSRRVATENEKKEV